MTKKELQKIINDSPVKGELNSLSLKFEFPHIDTTVEKKGFLNIYWFIQEERKKWEKIEGDLKGTLEDSARFWINGHDEIYSFIQNNVETNEALIYEEGRYKWSRIKSNLIPDKKKVLLYDHSYTTFLIRILNNYPQNYIGTEVFLLGEKRSRGYYNEDTNFNKLENLTGALMAYEFKHSDHSDIIKKRTEEEKFYEELKNKFSNLYEDTKAKANDFKTKQEDNIIKNQQDFVKWLDQVKGINDTFNTNSKERLQELEATYADKLMLEKPAEYWKQRAIELNTEGQKWTYWLIGSSVLAIAVLSAILLSINNNTLEAIFSNAGSGIRWSIVLIGIISLIAFVIRTFARLAFSSYHLARDAEERKQLVYVYLALKEEKAIETEERKLILQSIFSRADSGLIKGDTSPTLPGASGVIEKMLK